MAKNFMAKAPLTRTSEWARWGPIAPTSGVKRFEGRTVIIDLGKLPANDNKERVAASRRSLRGKGRGTIKFVPGWDDPIDIE